MLTFGCRVNQADSFACERDLADSGGEPAPPEDADLVVVNTCSVTAAADQAARQAIRRISRANPSVRIVATGCYATRSPRALELPGVVRVVPNERKADLPSEVAALPWPPASVPARAARKPARSAFRPGDRGRTTFPLRVQTGCDESCSYCTIPASRGPSRSRPLDEVLEEARGLVASGYKELVLTGVHLGAWGRDLRPAASLIHLLTALDAEPGDFAVRISSLEPMDCTRSIIRLVGSSERFQPHLHFPLQHASDRLLHAMRRPYVLDDHRRLVEATRAAMPHAAIGCDVIVGFPSETSADHQELVHYLSASPVTHLHVFPYSERPGTAAAAMDGKVPPSVVSRRCADLREVSTRLSRAFAERQVGVVRPALTIENGSRAVTDNYLKVAIPPVRGRNERVAVRILSAAPLRGEVVA